jgi:rhamnose utilization protein RhaD (predicted bifunctional aldolase and dehydrogenase)
VGEALALRTYSARLLGADPDLVLHGGGNTSVKTTVTGLLGETIPVLCVKGSGWDLATIEPPGHPAVRLEPLLALRALDRLSDEAMVAAQRQNLIDPAAPNPSVEALLHAFLPHTYVDHTHSIALLALADQPDAEVICRQVDGDRVALVPYVMPGFDLALAAAAAYEQAAARAAAQGIELEGMVLLKHGLFSFGATARQSYERMIALVRQAEQRIELARGAESSTLATPVPAPARAAAAVLPILRGALGRAAEAAGAPSRWLLDWRSTPEVLALVNDGRLAGWASRGVATPDHVIRTKAQPLVLPANPSAAEIEQALAAYIAAYQAYFQRQNARAGGIKTALDPLPRLVAIPGLGLVGIGKARRMPPWRPISAWPGPAPCWRPKPWVASSRSMRPTPSRWSTGAWSRPSSARAKRSPWRARWCSSPAPAAPSVRPRPWPLPDKGLKWPCSTAMAWPLGPRPKPAAGRPWPSPATSRIPLLCGRPSTRWWPASAVSTWW